jgi:F-type H+-transporting ATPase subunit delta
VTDGGAIIGRRYATAIYELAEQAEAVDAIGEQLDALARAYGESEQLQDVFQSPSYGLEARTKVARALGEKAGAHDHLKALLGMLSHRGRMPFLPDISEAYGRLAEKRSGRIRAEVVTAHELPEAYFTQLKKTLEGATGKKVVLVRKRDADLIGGVVTKVGGRVFDGSLRHRLRTIRAHLMTATDPSAQRAAGDAAVEG